MAITGAAFGELSVIGTVVFGIEHAAGGAFLGDAVATQIFEMCASGACLIPCRTTLALTIAARDRAVRPLAAPKLAARPRPKVLPRAPPDRRLNPPAFSAAA